MTYLADLYRSSHDALVARLLGVDVVPHAGEKGCASENDWREFLAAHLPARYALARAFVVDSRGMKSDQLDLVIYDRHFSPLLLDRSGLRFLPAESVYGVFEVKQDISRENIRYAADKVASVRALHRTSAPLVDRGVARPPRPLPKILGGILASRSSWSSPLGESFESALRDCVGAGELDLGCALSHGSFEQEAALRTCEADVALMFFIMALLRRLQAMGTVPAIDWTAYEQALEGGNP